MRDRLPDVELADLGILPDEPALLRDALLRAAGEADLIVTSGGASVGEEDYMAGAILAAGGTIEVVHLPIRPGKPVKAGRLGAAVVLALPGNPLAAFVNLWLMGRRVLESTLQRVCPHFAYPFGDEGSFGERDVHLALEADFASAVSSQTGLISASGASDPLNLPRIVWDGRCSSTRRTAYRANRSRLCIARAWGSRKHPSRGLVSRITARTSSLCITGTIMSDRQTAESKSGVGSLPCWRMVPRM